MTRYRLALVAFVGFLILVIATADAGRGARYWGFLDRIPLGDKLCHFAFMATLSFLANLATGCRAVRVGRLGPILVATAVVTVFVVGEEISQIWIPARTFDLLDLTADLIGIALGDRLARRVVSLSRRAPES
jgi:VanZ family protein